MSTPIPLACPKCAAEMTTYERAGDHVDQCRECRSVLLDRGELDRLIDLESQATVPIWPEPVRAADWHAGRDRDIGPTWTPDPDACRAWGRDDDDDDDRPWARDGRRTEVRIDDPRGHPRSRKRSFLGELFEGFGN